jgi:glycoside/pentoside/hexuronide:cation symporter, GPH family
VQSERALLGIRLAASIFPAIAFLMCAVCLMFYRIDKSLELEMSRDLAERRDAFLPTPLPSAP